jgi:hypothetical protein
VVENEKVDYDFYHNHSVQRIEREKTAFPFKTNSSQGEQTRRTNWKPVNAHPPSARLRQPSWQSFEVQEFAAP